MANEKREYKQISVEELKKVLAAHKLWVESNGNDGICADLHGYDLSGKKIFTASVDYIDLSKANLNAVNLTGADLFGATLSGANLCHAKIHDTDFGEADISEADLRGADIARSSFYGANISGANMMGLKLLGMNLCESNLSESNLSKTDLMWANLSGSDLMWTKLTGAKMLLSKLNHTGFQGAILDGETYIWGCQIDQETDFSGVGLGSTRIEPGLRQALEYNIRRKRWTKWCDDLPWFSLKRWVAKGFWKVSDYGASTSRILVVFGLLSLAFAGIYWAGAMWTDGGFVTNLSAVENGEAVTESLPGWMVPVRAFYFSVVTMTTLGFGDISARPQSLTGHILLTIQVLLGYGLLGALVTRLGILFTSDGPSLRVESGEKDRPADEIMNDE